MEVTFVVRGGERVTKKFDSYVACRSFVEKARRSRNIILISYPTFRRN